MLTYVQLEASDDQVVSYLKKLWNGDKPISTPVDEQTQLNHQNLTVSDGKTGSLIQQLIDADILQPVSNNESIVESCEPKNNQTIELSEFTNQEFLTEKPVESVTVEDITLAEAEPKQETENKIQNDYVKIDNNSNNNSSQSPVTIQLDNNLTNTNNSDINMQVEQVDHVEQVEQIVLDAGDKVKFRKQVKGNLSKIREIGFRVYHDIELEKEVNLVTSTVTNGDIDKVFDFKFGRPFSRKSLMGDISRCIIFAKHKSGDKTKPENFRYLVNHHNTVKILDRIWCSELILKCGNNLPDKNIFKSTLVKAFNGSIITTACENTKSFDNVVMIDVMKAFDSLDWDILEELLLANLTRKINKENATELVTQYMTILKNRELYYNNIRVEVSKGIPTGLPSSNLVFTLAIEEILFRWFNKLGYSNNKDFKLNVYVDDIYMQILNLANASDIVNSLIDHLENYKLKVNKDKTKADENLKIAGLTNYIKPSDYYLGIPFTRDVKLYGELILSEIKKKHNFKSWLDIYDILLEERASTEKSSVYGFLNYKLRPFFVTNADDNVEFDKKFITSFVYENYAKEAVKQRDTRIKQLQQVLITLVVVLTAISVTMFTSYVTSSQSN